MWFGQIEDKINQTLIFEPTNIKSDNKSMETALNSLEDQKKILNNLNEQLFNPLILKIPNILKSYKVVHQNELNKKCTYFEKTLEEIEDRNIHLLTLKLYYDLMNQMSFEELHVLFKPIFHNLSLIWSFSQYYRIPEKFSSLIQLFFDFMIKKASFT